MLLAQHLDEIESKLGSHFEHSGLFAASANLGPLREAFVRSFLANHLSHNARVSSGEVIDRNSTDEYQSRNQHDVIIFDPNFPRLSFDVIDIQMFLAESVFATMEIKSTLSQDELARAVEVASKTKKLIRNLVRRSSKANLVTTNSGQWWPLGIVNFVVAYQSPTIETVHGWFEKIHKDLSIDYALASRQERVKIQAPSVDGIFVLNRGFLLYDNVSFINIEDKKALRDTHRWLVSEKTSGNLRMLFYLLSHCIDGLDLGPYLKISDIPLGQAD